MKKINNISRKWRRFTAVLLLLNFSIVSLLAAFPTEKCDAMCSNNSNIHVCGRDILENNINSCCNGMDINSAKNSFVSNKCGMKISDIDCNFILAESNNGSYLIPKTNSNKIEFVQISILDFQKENLIIELFGLNFNCFLRAKPPLYLFNESFLI